MKKYFVNPTRKDTILLAILYAIFGLVLCFFHGSILSTIVRIIGIVVIAYGAYMLYGYFFAQKNSDMTLMISGIPAVIFGLFMAVWPQTLINMVPIVAGIVLLFNSVVQIQRALVMKRAGLAEWTLTLVLALVMLAIAVFLIIRPANVTSMLVWITGIALMIEAVILFLQAFSRS